MLQDSILWWRKQFPNPFLNHILAQESRGHYRLCWVIPVLTSLLWEALEESEAAEYREEVARGHTIPCMYRPRDRAPTLANLSFDFQPTAHGIPEPAEAKGLPLSLH